MNSLPKYVVSSTLQDPAWNNSTILKGDAANEISKLKQQLDGDIVVYASFQLVRMLMEHDLVDELRLMVYPVVLRAGERLFGETSDKKPIRLTGNRTVGDGLVFLTYECVRDACQEPGGQCVSLSLALRAALALIGPIGELALRRPHPARTSPTHRGSRHATAIPGVGHRHRHSYTYKQSRSDNMY